MSSLVFVLWFTLWKLSTSMGTQTKEKKNMETSALCVLLMTRVLPL